MISKAQLQKTIESFPEVFSLDHLMEKLILLDKIAKGDLDSKEGRTISEEEMEQEMKKWFE
jgi:hypothetical protein